MALPLIGLGTGAPFSLNHISGGARYTFRRRRQIWKCAIVAGPGEPTFEVTLHVSIRVAQSKVRSAVRPVAVVCTRALYLLSAVRRYATLKESGAACDDAAQAAMPATLAATITPRREIEILVVVSLDCVPRL